MKDEIYEQLRRKYIEKLKAEVEGRDERPLRTTDYEHFRNEYLPRPFTWYEKMCHLSEKLLPIAPDEKKAKQMARWIEVSHLQVTPGGVMAFSFLLPIIMMFGFIFLFWLLPPMLNLNGSSFVMAYGLIVSAILIIPLGNAPKYIANSWRMKASNEMVLCVFYIVTYMRHTSNLELAIDFASAHLSAPMNLDMKKVLWGVETEKFDSIRESLEHYLDTWHEWNPEFVEAMHLIEGSLVETAESRRLETLEKSLSVILDETYEKMLHYAHNLKGPLTTLHMLGIILPILGLVILPLMVSFMPSVRWYHLSIIYNVTLPLLVYFIGRDILSKRPTGYGSGEVNEEDIAAAARRIGVKTKTTFSPIMLSFCIIVGCLFIGAIPLLMHTANPTLDFVHYGDSRDRAQGCVIGFCPVDVTDDRQLQGTKYRFNEYREVVVDEDTGETITVGPFGLIATLLSVFLPLGLGVGVGMYFHLRTGKVLALREQAKKLEVEFASALFQLGNRLADGLPLEIAFSRVAEVMPDTVSGRFYRAVSINITKLGLSVEEAIFSERFGAIKQYPSSIIESGMKVLVESSKKGPIIASQAIINVSNYIKEMHRVDERLKDLMADVISSMKSQIKFLTPVIAGIVMGITSMITAILGRLGERVALLQQQTASSGQSAAVGTSILSTFSGGGVPTYFFQIVIGLYVVELVFVLTMLVNGIENGSDRVGERAMLGENLVHSTFTYVILSFIVMLAFNVIASNLVPAAG